MTEENKNLFNTEEWKKLSKIFQEAIEHEKDLSESFWNGLSSEEQLWAFCAIMRRLSKSYFEEGGRSYRGVLYDVMGWGPEAYATAQCSGFLDIHNSIFSDEELVNMIVSINKLFSIEIDQEKVADAVSKRRWY